MSASCLKSLGCHLVLLFLPALLLCCPAFFFCYWLIHLPTLFRPVLLLIFFFLFWFWFTVLSALSCLFALSVFLLFWFWLILMSTLFCPSVLSFCSGFGLLSCLLYSVSFLFLSSCCLVLAHSHVCFILSLCSFCLLVVLILSHSLVCFVLSKAFALSDCLLVVLVLAHSLVYCCYSVQFFCSF